MKETSLLSLGHLSLVPTVSLGFFYGVPRIYLLDYFSTCSHGITLWSIHSVGDFLRVFTDSVFGLVTSSLVPVLCLLGLFSHTLSAGIISNIPEQRTSGMINHFYYYLACMVYYLLSTEHLSQWGME